MRRFYLIVLPLLLAACVSMGNKQIQDPELVKQIVPGQSTKAEVRALVGEPSETTFSDTGEETWKYMLHRAQPRPETFIPFVGGFIGGADMQMHTLTVRFRKDGVVGQVGSGKTTGVTGPTAE